MKILTLYRYMATCNFLSSLVVFLILEMNGVSGRSDLKTKLLLQNIRTQLAQKAGDIIKKRECESDLISCKHLKGKEEERDKEKSEEILPSSKLVRKQYNPFIKVNTKDNIQIQMPKEYKTLYKKRQGFSEFEKHRYTFQEKSRQNNERSKADEKTSVKSKKPASSKDKKSKQLMINEEQKLQESFKITPSKVTRGELNSDAFLQSAKKMYRKTIKTEERKIAAERERVAEDEKRSKKMSIEIKKPKMEADSPDERVAAEETPIFQPGGLIFVLDSDDVENNVCGKHSQIYLKQLKKYQIWALMMYDASAKFSSGILQGNVNQYGDFDECLAINAVFKNLKSKSKRPSGIKGKYCLANVDVTTDSESQNLRLALERVEGFQFIKSTIHDPGHFIPRFSTINWGLCVPSACLAKDVEKFLKSRLEVFGNATGLRFDVNIDESNCVVKDDLKYKLEMGTVMTILFYLAVLCVSLYATFLDKSEEGKDKKLLEQEKIERELEEAAKDADTQQEFSGQEIPGNEFYVREKIKEIVMAFSIKKNLRKLFSDNNKGAIECINGIKSIFTVALYFAHKTIPLGMIPFTNRIFLTKMSNQPITILLRASIIYTDSFLLISGVLTSYNLAKELSEKKEISWTRKWMGRFLRLTPALFAVILFYAYIWDQLGSGPIWNLVVNKNSLLCRKFMWRNFLYIQNLFLFEDMCAPQTHQLALDMQLSLLAPFFVHLMHTYDKAGVGILQALFILSSILRYISTSHNKLSVVIYHGMPVSQLYKTANILYGQMFHRASSYILGTVVGYHLKKYEKQFDMPKAFAALGWILSLTFGFYSIVSPSALALKVYEYNVEEAAQYAALSPVAWSLSLSWLIVACHLGYGGFLNEFLCQKLFLVFSRISYSVYLTQFLVFFYNVGVKRIPEMFTLADSVNAIEFSIVIGTSIVLTLLFDIPMAEIKKIILEKNVAASNLLEDDAKRGHVLQSTQSFQTDDKREIETDLNEEEQRIIDETEETIEEADGDEDADENEETEGKEADAEESSEEVSDEEVTDDEEAVEEVFEIRRLKHSPRTYFGEEFEDDKCFKVETEIKEGEQK